MILGQRNCSLPSHTKKHNLKIYNMEDKIEDLTASLENVWNYHNYISLFIVTFGPSVTIFCAKAPFPMR